MFSRFRPSWVGFAALFGVLHLVSSCVGSSSTEESASVSAATTTAAGFDAAPAAFLPPEGNPELLSEWNQLASRDGQLVLMEGVTPYGLQSALFTDNAHKLRTVWMPDGAAAAMPDPDETFDFPVGTVITKTFYYPESGGSGEVLLTDPDDRALAGPLTLADVRLIETRVLVRRDDGWAAIPYVWDEDETDATLARTGDVQTLAAVADDGTKTPLTYVVPNANQCSSCHATNHTSGEIQPIGPKARHLNRTVDFGDGPVSQLGHWQSSGMLVDAPAATEMPRVAAWNDESASVEDRARAYLDINCAHCHNPVGAADTSGLFLDVGTEIGTRSGICKAPVAAGSGSGGRLFDIVPGRPDESILVYRMESTDPASMMPELGRSLSDEEGVELIIEWIETLSGEC